MKIHFIKKLPFFLLLFTFGCKNDENYNALNTEPAPAVEEINHVAVYLSKFSTYVEEFEDYFSTYRDIRDASVRQKIQKFEDDIISYKMWSHEIR